MKVCKYGYSHCCYYTVIIIIFLMLKVCENPNILIAGGGTGLCMQFYMQGPQMNVMALS